MDRLERGLRWIADILERHRVPFQLTGGLAAHAYGATRPIHDIDLDIPEDRFEEVLAEVRPYVIYGPEHYRDKVWDLMLMTLNYHGQEIDLGGAYDTRILDEKTGEWHDCRADLAATQLMTVCGVTVPVVSKRELMEYKAWLALPGDHQERDVREMRAAGETGSAQVARPAGREM